MEGKKSYSKAIFQIFKERKTYNGLHTNISILQKPIFLFVVLAEPSNRSKRIFVFFGVIAILFPYQECAEKKQIDRRFNLDLQLKEKNQNKYFIIADWTFQSGSQKKTKTVLNNFIKILIFIGEYIFLRRIIYTAKCGKNELFIQILYMYKDEIYSFFYVSSIELCIIDSTMKNILIDENTHIWKQFKLFKFRHALKNYYFSKKSFLFK